MPDFGYDSTTGRYEPFEDWREQWKASDGWRPSIAEVNALLGEIDHRDTEINIRDERLLLCDIEIERLRKDNAAFQHRIQDAWKRIEELEQALDACDCRGLR